MKKLKINRYWFYAAVILALVIFSRFFMLGLRPLHHDEGMLSYFAWQLMKAGDYVYTPQIHSPILFYVEALLYLIFGASDYVSKLGPAIFGVVLVAIPLVLYKTLGKTRSIAIAGLFIISPIILYYSRFLVHTSMLIVFLLPFVIFTWKFFATFKTKYLYPMAVSLALSFGTSEVTYIFMASVISFILIFFLLARKRFFARLKKLWRFLRINYLDLITATMIFVFVWVLIYSAGFTNPESLHRSLPLLKDPNSGLGFWLAQNPKKLGSQPWFYYLILLLVYEPLIVVGYLHGAVSFVFEKKRSIFLGFLLWWALSSLVIFSWAGEKFPWLLLPSLLALTVCVGYFLGGRWRRLHIAFKIIYLVLAAWTVFVAIRLNYIEPAQTKELAVYVQTPPSFQTKINEILRDCKNSPKSQNCILIDQGVSWPISWNFREYSTLVFPESLQIQPETKYVIIGSENIGKAKKPEGWNSQTTWIRDWWVPTPCRKLSCARDFAKYFLLRTIWNEKGGYDVYIFKR